MKDTYLFLKRFFSAPTEIGALLPSSKKIGLCIAKRSELRRNYPIRCLEIGAGSGALTRPLVQNMHENDWLDIVESDHKFCDSLRKQFAHCKNVAIHEASILDFDGKNYDVLVSSLPLNAFKAQMVNKILHKYESLVKTDGYLSYYEYLGLKTIKEALLFGQTAQDFKNAQGLKKKFADQYREKIDTVWLNFPPARVIHCKIKKDRLQHHTLGYNNS